MPAIQSKNLLVALIAIGAVVGVLLFTTGNNNNEASTTGDFILSGNPTTQELRTPITNNDSTKRSEVIRGFLPAGGAGAACTEDVGVLLAPSYEAILTINGTTLAPEQLNVNLNSDGSISDIITATRSKGQFSFRPEPDCPNGELIRPTNNSLTICVFANSDPTKSCVITETFTFSAI